MKAILATPLIGTLARALTIKTVGTTDIAEGTLAMVSIQNGRTLTNYVSVVFVGAAARRVVDRTTAGSVLSVQDVPRQEKWENAEGKKRSRVRIQALRTEVLSGDFATVVNRTGGTRLAQGVNQVTLGGNLVATPEVWYTPGGDAVTDFSLALNEKYTTRKNEVEERVSFVEVTAGHRSSCPALTGRTSSTASRRRNSPGSSCWTSFAPSTRGTREWCTA